MRISRLRYAGFVRTMVVVVLPVLVLDMLAAAAWRDAYRLAWCAATSAMYLGFWVWADETGYEPFLVP